ncbi:MAG: F0F1 ATP synthase subunit epsilon [Candidatus Zixiibacteriota bacterium]|nr:MAG: F0F1 ATP synthase subunit epsilon [candidate division Zixibacteria bacterium]
MFKLSVVTPEKTVFEMDVRSIIAPGSEGYLGILSNHAPLITALKPGILSVNDQSGNETFYSISGGFLEVSGNIATILADAIESADEIDLERAEESLKRARERLLHKAELHVDTERVYASIERARNRLKLAKRKR